ncbi:MAG TPA: DUF2179 domain-containing protein [Sediminispirochaeta sp.]|nr:DUF2179 domain-containing protein [Sediminispirochaeta sp.]
MSYILSDPFFSWVVLPMLIFLARILDVSIGTLRIMFVSKGQRMLAPILGFFEVLIWLLALTRIMQNLSNPMTYIAYSAGFATGTYIGILLEEKLAMGICIIRIITRDRANQLVKVLRAEGYGVTFLEAQGNLGKVAVLYSLIKRSDIAHFTEIIHEYNPKAFYSIEDVRFVSQGVFPARRRVIARPLRKGK